MRSGPTSWPPLVERAGLGPTYLELLKLGMPVSLPSCLLGEPREHGSPWVPGPGVMESRGVGGQLSRACGEWPASSRGKGAWGWR